MTEPSYDPTEPMWALPNIALYFLAAQYGMTVQAQTLQKWARRAHVRRQGDCYSLRDIITYLDNRPTNNRADTAAARRGEERRRVDC